LYFAKNYPRQFRRMLTGVAAQQYPFAITGLNITNMLFEILGWGMRPRPSRARERFSLLLLGGPERGELQPNAFEECYCTAFFIFDQEWVARRATYLDFPAVKESCQTKVEVILSSMDTLEQLKQRNLQTLDADLISF